MGRVFKKIAPEEIMIAEHLAPPAELDRLCLPGYMGILAVDEESNTACGLTICQMVSTDRLDIVWLYVYEDYRGKGVGEEMIMAACDLAMEYGYELIGFKIEAGDLTNKEIRDLDGYLTRNGFGIGFDIEGCIRADVSQVVLRTDRLSDPGEAVPIESVNKKLMARFIYDVSILFDEELFSSKYYAKDLSFSYKKNGIICGVLLSQVIGDMIHVYLMEPADNEDVCGILLGAMIDKAKGLGVRTFQITRCEANEETLDILFAPEYSLPAHLWLGRADMYDALEDDKEEEDPVYVSTPKQIRWLKTEYFGDIDY